MLEARTRAPSFDPKMERLPPPLSPPADKSPRAQHQLLADRNNFGPRHPSGLGHARGTKMRQACNAKGHAGRQSNSGAVIPTRQATPLGTTLPPRGPFQDRVDRIFFFGDLNYRVDLAREDLEIGLAVGKRREGEWTGTRKLREKTRGTL